jgi:hypothetical protein
MPDPLPADDQIGLTGVMVSEIGSSVRSKQDQHEQN